MPRTEDKSILEERKGNGRHVSKLSQRSYIILILLPYIVDNKNNLIHLEVDDMLTNASVIIKR